MERALTRQGLGVPDWFFCDGCSHSPDSKWLTPACNRHDWDHWVGSTADRADERRLQADKDLRATIKHNAKFYPGSWFDRLWRPPLGEIYYMAVTRFGKRYWRIRERNDWTLAELEELAKLEGKWVPV